MATKVCAAQGCSGRIPEGSRARYHTKTCRDRESKRRWRASKIAEVIDPGRITRGDVYATLLKSPALVTAIRNGDISINQAAAAVGVPDNHFRAVWATYLAETLPGLEAEDWKMGDFIRKLLCLDEWDFSPGADLEAWLDFAVEQFVQFRHLFFRTPRGPYITKAFHRIWIRGILKALITGGRYMVLSPPRHGKSELLSHFVVWLIARNPDIRIAWIGGNEEIAKDMVGLVKATLETNEELIAACLPPGHTWAPSSRQKARWGITKLTVANRTTPSKTATLTARSRGGKLLSTDLDLCIEDDIEDYDSTLNELERGKTRNWQYNNVESRKEDHTAWVMIGSRQHPDDIYDYMLLDPEWETQVDSAHAPWCHLDPYNHALHVECMLFPELRSYTWLMSKRNSAEAQGLLANYEMVYLNAPRPEGSMVYDEAAIERSKNPNRGVGLGGIDRDLKAAELPIEYYLVGGLDPSASGFQAAFLWAWVPEINKLYAADIDNRRGGGIYEAWALMRDWLDRYDLKHWVYEDNGFQAEYQKNREFLAWREENEIYLEPHTTGANKNSTMYGLGTMAGLYDQDLVDLPWGDEHSRELFGLYIRQMVRFVEKEGLVRKVNRPTDVHMASWFPMKAIRRFRAEVQAEASVSDDFSFVSFDQTEWNEVPW